MQNQHWKVDPITGELSTPTNKPISGLPTPTSASHPATMAYADESRGLVLSYNANKTLAFADFLGRDLSKALVTVVFTAASTAYLPNDASRVVGARITFIRTYNGNLIIDGNGANVQGRSHTYGGSNWFVGTVAGAITYEWTGSVWTYVGIPATVDGQIQPSALYLPNTIPFADNNLAQTGVVPVRRSHNASLGNGTFTIDHPMTDGVISDVTFEVRLGSYILKYLAIATRSGGTVTPLTTTPKAILQASDYASPPSVSAIGVAANGTNLRFSITHALGTIVASGFSFAKEHT